MEELKRISPESIEGGCKELWIDAALDEEKFNSLTPDDAFEYLLKYYKPIEIVEHIIAYKDRPTVVAKPVASMKVGRRSKRRSKKKGSSKRSKKKKSKKRRSREY